MRGIREERERERGVTLQFSPLGFSKHIFITLSYVQQCNKLFTFVLFMCVFVFHSGYFALDFHREMHFPQETREKHTPLKSALHFTKVHF